MDSIDAIPELPDGAAEPTDRVDAVVADVPHAVAAAGLDARPANGFHADNSGSVEANAAGAARAEADSWHEPHGRAAYCTNCGTRNLPDANFCKQCGQRVERTGPIRISEEQFLLAGSREELTREYMLQAYHQYEADDIDGAIRACSKALAAMPESTDAHSLMSTLYEKRGDRDNAIAERERVLELNPGSIADREKLEELREGRLRTAHVKVNTAHRAPGAGWWDSRTGAGMVAVGVALFVLVAGSLAVVLGRNRRVDALNTRPNAGQLSAAAVGPAGQQSAYQQPSNQAPQWSAVGQPRQLRQPEQPQQYADADTSDAPVRRAATRRNLFPDESASDTRSAQPARVNGLGVSPMEGGRAADASGAGAPGTVHLPDSPLSPSETGPPPSQAAAGGPTVAGMAQPFAPQPAAPARPNHGIVRIVVSPDAGSSHGSNSSPNVRGQTSDSDSGSGASMDSRSQVRVAQDLQLRGQYRQAATAYIKALDGAGDAAADIHQRIGYCYQKFGDNDSAVAQYNQAIAGYRAQIAAGKNVDAAQSGIRVCEAGIKVCQ